MGKYSKFIVSVLGTITTGLSTFYSGSHWVPVASEALTAAAVYLVPSTSSIPADKPAVQEVK